MTTTNTDAISVGQLLLEFFEFYGFTFENEKYAIDIRHCDASNRPAPFRLRQDFVDEAERELQAKTEENNFALGPKALLSNHQS